MTGIKGIFLILISLGLLLPALGYSQFLPFKLEGFVAASTPSPFTNRKIANEKGYDVSNERFPIYPGAGIEYRNGIIGISGAFFYNPVTFTASFPAQTGTIYPFDPLSANAKGHYLQFQPIFFVKKEFYPNWCLSIGAGANVHFLLGSSSVYELQNHSYFTQDDYQLLRRPIPQIIEQFTFKRYFKKYYYIGGNLQAMQSTVKFADEHQLFPLKSNQFAGTIAVGYLINRKHRIYSPVFR